MLCVCLLTHPEEISTGCCSQPDELWFSASIDSGILELKGRALLQEWKQQCVLSYRFGQLHIKRGKGNFYYDCSSPNKYGFSFTYTIFFLLFYGFFLKYLFEDFIYGILIEFV